MADGSFEEGEGSEGPPSLDTTVVPGHLHAAPILVEILKAQEAAGAAERATWQGKNYSTAPVGSRSLALFKNRAIVPDGATAIKLKLLRMAHDSDMH
jgi:hypothetical protein